MRFFVAYELSEGTFIYLRKVNAQLLREVGGRYMPENHLHLTLSFLGEVGAEKIGIISEITERVFGAYNTPEVSLQRLISFSSVLGVTVKGSEALYSAHKMMFNELSLAGFKLDSRPYRPHITLVRDFTSELAVKEINKSVLIANRPQKTAALTLFQSIRTSGGAEYLPVCSFKN